MERKKTWWLIFNNHRDIQDQQAGDENFVAIHKDAVVGAKETLNPEMRSLIALTIKYLPVDYQLVNVISATREVVAGIRYNVLVNALINQTEPEICELEILEKPWIVTEFGEKQRFLKASNCSTTEEMNAFNEEAAKINPIFQQKPDEDVMTDARMANVEDQIIAISDAEEPKEQKKTQATQETAVPNDNLKARIQEALQVLFNTDENVRAAIAAIVTSSNAKEVQIRYESTLEQLVQSVVKNIFNDTANINESFSYEIPIRLDKAAGPVDGAVVYVEKEVTTNSSRRKRRSVILTSNDGDQVRFGWWLC